MTFILSCATSALLFLTTILFPNLWLIFSDSAFVSRWNPTLVMTALTAFTVILFLLRLLSGKPAADGHCGFSTMLVCAFSTVLTLLKAEGSSLWLLIPALIYLTVVCIYAFGRKYTKRQFILCMVMTLPCLIIMLPSFLEIIRTRLLPLSMFPFMH